MPHDCPDRARGHRCRCRTRARRAAAPPAGRVPALATVRTVRGLMLAGHAAGPIARAAGLSLHNVRRLVDAPPATVLARTAAGIAAARDRLTALPGRDDAARERALAAGWAPLHAWDEVIRIDDPDVDDDLAARTAGMRPELRGVIRDDELEARRRAADLHRRRVEVGRRARAAEDPAALAARARHAGHYRWARKGAQRATQTARRADRSDVLPNERHTA